MRAPDLDALDAALAGEPGADAALLTLVREVRAEAPEPDPAFLASLDERVAAGFPAPEHARRRWLPRRGQRARRRLTRPLAVAAAALFVATIVLATDRGDEPNQVNDIARGGGSGAAVEDAPGPASSNEQRGDSLGSADFAAPSASAPSATPPAGRGDRRVERAAQLTLTPPADEIQAVADGVTRTTQDLGGFVESSQVTTSADGGSGSLRLRVPSGRLATAIERLSALAPVGALSQSATDITGATDARAERLADARAERQALLRALGRASTDREIASLRERLRLNRSRLAAARGALESVRRRARLSTVDVAVQASGEAGEDGGGAWTPRDALGDALRVLQVAAGVALVGAAILAPVLLLVAAGVVAGRVAARRRREQALDAT